MGQMSVLFMRQVFVARHNLLDEYEYFAASSCWFCLLMCELCKQTSVDLMFVHCNLSCLLARISFSGCDRIYWQWQFTTMSRWEMRDESERLAKKVLMAKTTQKKRDCLNIDMHRDRQFKRTCESRNYWQNAQQPLTLSVHKAHAVILLFVRLLCSHSHRAQCYLDSNIG